MLKLHPIFKTVEENQEFFSIPEFREGALMTIEFYKVVGFEPPWIGYFASNHDGLVGVAGYKGRPKNNTIEIAYGTFPQHQQKGIGTLICNELVNLAQKTDPNIIITARTFPENNFSTRILEKNNSNC